jgi:hypothetical protein
MVEWLKLWSGRAALALLVALFAVGLAYSFPVDLAFLFALDLATWVETAIAVYAAMQVTRIRPLLTLVRARLFARRRTVRRQARKRVSDTRRKGANDDRADPHMAWAA